jgi:hypothetical protein
MMMKTEKPVILDYRAAPRLSPSSLPKPWWITRKLWRLSYHLGRFWGKFFHFNP